MSLFALLAMQAAASATAAAPPPRDVTVYGRRLDDAYRACAAGGCSVLRDAQVSIAMAEQQFRRGEYVKAKGTMAAAVSRNRGNAATDPKPVAALYEAYATVSLQEGDTGAYRRAVSGRVRTVRDNLPGDDPVRRDAALAVGDMWVNLRQPRNAEIEYRAAEARARSAGDARGALTARLRRAILAADARDAGKSRRLLRDVAADATTVDPVLVPVARALELQVAGRPTDEEAINRLVGDAGHAAPGGPTLLWAPPVPLAVDDAVSSDALKFGEVDPARTRSSDSETIQWADVGFWIGPDGRTRDARTLRGVNEGGWIGPVLRQIAARRYTAADSGPDQGVYRVERFTNRGIYITPTGSWVRRRGGPKQLEILDVTDAPAAPTVPK